MKKQINLILVLLISNFTQAQYSVKTPSFKDETLPKIKGFVELNEKLTQAGLTFYDVEFNSFGLFKKDCDKLYFACEGDHYESRVTFETKKNNDGISYIGEVSVHYYRYDQFCNLLPKFEFGGISFVQWSPIGKKSGVTNEEAAMAFLKKAFDNKEILSFTQKKEYSIWDLISIDNIVYNPAKLSDCDIENASAVIQRKKMYQNNKVLENNEVIVFAADLTFAEFRVEDVDGENIYSDIENFKKGKYMFNLWLSSDQKIQSLKYAELNCDEIETLLTNDGNSYHPKMYADITHFGSESVWNKLTEIPFSKISFNYRSKFLNAMISDLNQCITDKKFDKTILERYLDEEIIEKYVQKLNSWLTVKGAQISISKSSNSGQNKPIYTLEINSSKLNESIELNIWNEDNFNSKTGKLKNLE
jgi:hypothetical protein